MNNRHNKLIIAIVCLALICGAGVAAYMERDKLPAIASIGGPAISEETKDHILIGDKTGGGHKFGTGKNCKSEFPKEWSDGEIIGSIKKVAANDNLKWKKQNNGYYVATDKVNNVRIRVVLDKERDDIVTGYPLTKRNACPPRQASVTTPQAKPENVEPSTGSKADNVANASNRKPRTSNINKAD